MQPINTCICIMQITVTLYIASMHDLHTYVYRYVAKFPFISPNSLTYAHTLSL